MTLAAEPLAIQSVGLVSSVGMDAASSCAAIRARLSRFEELSFHDQQGNPIIGAPAIEVAGKYQGGKRLVMMLLGAIRECVSSYQEHEQKHGRPLVLLIATGELGRPDYERNLPSWLLAQVKAELGVIVSPESAVLSEGQTGFFAALARARLLMSTGQVNSCIVSAVDSYLNVGALKWLEKHNHLKTKANCDGIIPGEAAAAVLITREKLGDRPLANILGLGFGQELSYQQENTPNVALGLAEAMRQALKDAAVPLQAIDFRVGGMTGERYGFMEASTAVARIQRVHKDEFKLWVPAEKLGDVGAALPAAMVIVTVMGILKKYAPGPRALLFVTPNSAKRAACVVTAA